MANVLRGLLGREMLAEGELSLSANPFQKQYRRVDHFSEAVLYRESNLDIACEDVQNAADHVAEISDIGGNCGRAVLY